MLYCVKLPIAGAIIVDEVDATSPKEAIKKAIQMAGIDFLEVKDSNTCILDSLEVYEQILEGSFFYADLNEAEATELEDLE